MDLNEYRDIFINEAQEHLEAMNAAALRLEKDAADLGALSELFRSSHTLKGMAATMGFDAITELAHQMEDLLDGLRTGRLPGGLGLSELLYACIDTLGGQISRLAQGQDALPAPEDLVQRLRRSQQEGVAPAKAPAAAAPPPAAAQAPGLALGEMGCTLSVLVDPHCAFKGVRGFMVVRNLEKLGRLLACRPGYPQVEAGAFGAGFEVDLASSAPVEALRKACLKVLEVSDVEARPLAAPAALAPAAPEPAGPAPEPLPAPAGAARPVARQSVRVAVERLDSLMNLVGELVTHRIRLAQIARQHGLKDLKDSLALLERVVDELQDEVMSARMVPMDHVFNRFPRMVRDLAHELGKQVELEVLGKDIELDRSVLEEVSDPLVHILRNAVDHGIEPPEQRRKAGKPDQGLIRLSAQREKNQVLVQVLDDGAGIDPARLRQVAVQRGFLSAESAARLSDPDAVALIYAPGFSTAASVTSVSGRGVGLDAVKSKIEGFGGALRLESKPGQGTSFTLRLPLTLAIIQALLVKLGGETYAVPVAGVHEAVECASSELKPMQGAEVVMLRGQVLPVLRLGRLLEVPGAERPDPPSFTVLVAEAGERRIGLMVDAILGQQEVAIKSLGRFLKGIRGFGGVTVLGDGTIALILDVPSLL
jgi:two-component system chemotaxis sensor kinase CheA